MLREKIFGFNSFAGRRIRPCLETDAYAADLRALRKNCGHIAEELFEFGLCLPSGSNLTESDLSCVVNVIENVYQRKSVS